LRFFLILLTLTVLGPQFSVSFERQGWPDVVLLVDDSGSMGEPDFYQDEHVRQAVNKYAEKIRERLQQSLPEEIKTLEAQLDEAKKDAGRQDEAARLGAQVQRLQNR